MNTSCSECTFAVRDKEGRQTGCRANDRLHKFKERGTEFDLIEHDGKTSYVIKDRICLMCCPESKIQELKLKKPLEDMRNYIRLKCTAFILADNEHSLDSVKITVYSLLQQKLRPTKITVVIDSDKISRPQLARFLTELEDVFPNFAWQICHIHEEGASREWCLDHAVVVSKCETIFYCVFMAGFSVPEDYLSSIDTALNDELERFSLLLPADGYWNGAFISTLLHKSYHGNTPEKLEQYDDGELIATSIMDKISYHAEKANQKNMVRGVEEICKSMKAYKSE